MPVMVSILVSKWVSEAIQKHGIYDLVINLHNHPYLNSKESHMFTSTFADLCTARSTDPRNSIDLTDGKDVVAGTLKARVAWLREIGGQDGGFPIVKDGALVGYIAASELQYALGSNLSLPLHGLTKDQIPDDATLCVLGPLHESNGGECLFDDEDRQFSITDLRPYIDRVASLSGFI